MDFYDSVSPEKIPAGAAACLYADGLYKATQEQARRFKAVRWITVEGGAAAAAYAGCADFEPGNPVYGGEGALREWAEARRAMHCRARVYFDLSNARDAHDQVGDMENVVYWVAAYGEKRTAAGVVQLLAGFGVHAGAEKVWGLQYAGGVDAAYDTDVLLGVW